MAAGKAGIELTERLTFPTEKSIIYTKENIGGTYAAQQKQTEKTPAAQPVSVHAAGCSFDHRNHYLWSEGHERLGNL
ncbi:MAG: hypothetical protein IKM64_00745 [Clostridia bacterium]|nr:hypothetical protein [Clostridia bacterium]